MLNSLIKSFINRFGTTLYVQIWENRIKVTDIQTNAVFDEKPLVQVETDKNGVKKITAVGNQVTSYVNPFSHPRVLFSDFYVGQVLLHEIIKKLIGSGLFVPAPAIVLQAMEKTEGGLTQIEIRAFRELAFSAGARDALIHQGTVLADFKEIVKNRTDG